VEDALSGNSSDKESFRQTLNAHLKQLHDGIGLFAESLLTVPWIRRKHCKTLAIPLGHAPFPNEIGGTRELILAL